jgi:hypothetical protein
MSTTLPPVLVSLSQAEQDLVTAQANLATVLEAIDTENESFEAEITPLNTQAASLPAQIGYFMQQANSGQYMDKSAAAALLEAAQATFATVKAEIRSATATHVANLAALTVQQTEAAAQVTSLQRTIQQILSSISVAISPKPASMTLGTTLELSAMVEGDPDDAGVTWELYGKGTLSSITGSPVTYTAPADHPQSAFPYPNPGYYYPWTTKVTIIARSVTNGTVFDTLVFLALPTILPDGRPSPLGS